MTPTDTCFSNNGMSCDDGGGVPGGFIALIVIVVLISIGVTIYKMAMARDMAREAGMDEDRAAAMTLLDDNGLSATYLASNLRPAQSPPPEHTDTTRPVSARLAELESLHEQGLVTQAEYAERRAAILGSL